MIKGYRILFFGVFLFSYNISYPYFYSPEEEVKSNFASSFYAQEIDSLLFKEYRLIKKLYKKGEYSKSLDLALKLQNKSRNEDIIELELITTFLIGNIFRESKNYEKAMRYFQKSYKLYKKKINKNNHDFNNNFFYKKEYFYFDNLFKIAAVYQRTEKIDSAKFYYNIIISKNSLEDKFLAIKSNALSNLSSIFVYPGSKKNYNLAKEYALEAIKINKRLNNKVAEAASTASLANIYLELGENKKAEDYYKKALKLIKYNKDNKSIKFKEVFYDNLSWAMYQQKNYKAYDYLGMSYDIRDSLQNIEVQKILTEIEANHKVDLVKRKVELKKIQESKKVLYLSIGSLVLLVIFGWILYYYKLRQKNLKIAFSKNELQQQKDLEKLKNQSQIRILNATIDGKESERKQIAETLHDNVSALLSSANLHLQASKKQFNGKTPIEIDKTREIILEASQKIRDLSHTLVSSVLLKFGLSFALKDMAIKYSNSKISIKTEFKEINRYTQDFEIKVHNIVQELINNVLKHSKAKNALIEMKEEQNKLYINIQDDGIGFDKESILKKDGLGINQIEARIQMMKGVFVVDSKKDVGTVVKIEVPVVAKKPFSL